MKYKYIYGPVPSRRLGFSLGIDIIPFKNCSFNCIYCQVGQTNNLTVTRGKYSPVQDIITEINYALKHIEKIDYITFSGSGEPTLHSELGRLITEVKKLTTIPVAVLTNSSLINQAEVQQDLLAASVIAPTLCATTESIFRRINRPHHDVTISSIVSGLIQFRKKYKGAIWLEVMLVKGINDSNENIEDIKKTIDYINPDKIHLNTVVRPPIEISATPLTQNELTQIKKKLGDKAEVIVSLKHRTNPPAQRNIHQRILDIIRRRPITSEDICNVTSMNPHELTKYMTQLLEDKKIRITRHGDKVFYEIVTQEDE